MKIKKRLNQFEKSVEFAVFFGTENIGGSIFGMGFIQKPTKYDTKAVMHDDADGYLGPIQKTKKARR